MRDDREMMDLFRRAATLRASGRVDRWHTFPKLGSQSVADHVGQCLNLLFLLNEEPSMRLIKAMTWHDSAELRCGDVPAPVKRNNSDLRKALFVAEEGFYEEMRIDDTMNSLTQEDHAWLRSIDVLELIMWSRDQSLLGNQLGRFMSYRGLSYLENDEGTPRIVLETAMLTVSNYYDEMISEVY